MADFNFQFRAVKPSSGWTARSLVKDPGINTTVNSVVGGVNAAAQLPVTAAQLRTTPSTLSDPTLASRQYVNPNTGVRDPILSSSVYTQSNVPAFLAQSVADLNAEQALRRSLAAEWQNRLLQGVEAGGANSYLLAEALRAASVTPGASVGFGSAVADPLVGQGYYRQATSAAGLSDAQTRMLTKYSNAVNSLSKPQVLSHSPWGDVYGWGNQPSRSTVNALQPVAAAIGGAPRGAVVAPGGYSYGGWTSPAPSGGGRMTGRIPY